MNKLIAVVGMAGSGKSIVIDYLEKNGWHKIYFGGVIIDKLQEEGLQVNSDNEKYMRERLRKEGGMGTVAKLLLPQIKILLAQGHTVLDGLYSWDEYKILKEEFGDAMLVIAITVKRALRYNRLKVRKIRPFMNEEALARDIAEIENIEKGGPIAMADYFIDNSGNMEEYINAIEKTINQILNEKV